MTGLNVLYANEAMKEKEWETIPERAKTGRLREVYWARRAEGQMRPRRTSFMKMDLVWHPDRGGLGRKRDDPGDGFIHIARIWPDSESNFEWLEITEVFTTVPPERIEEAMAAWHCIGGKQPVDFDEFLRGLKTGRPTRSEQRRAADKVVERVSMKLEKASYRELLENFGYGTLVVGLPLWFAALPEDPWRSENAVDDFFTRTKLGLNELKRRILKHRDCPFRRIVVIWDTTPQALQEWRQTRSPEYEDTANMGLENPIPIAKMMTLLSESPEHEAPSMRLHVSVTTQKTRVGTRPYPELVVRLGQMVRQRDLEGDGLLGALKQRILRALLSLLCLVKICGLGGLVRWIARRMSVPHAWKARAVRRRARILYAESRRRAETRGAHAASG